jgi:molybdenum-dependent DNA-binding transcriptional regulator ModE
VSHADVHLVRSTVPGANLRDAVAAHGVVASSRRRPPLQRERIAASSRWLNLAGIDLVSIRLVVLCADCGSLSAAAKQGNMSLPTASHRLTSLEDFFKARLFERNHRGLQLTCAGVVFVSHARVMLQVLHRLNDRLLASGAIEFDAQVGHQVNVKRGTF